MEDIATFARLIWSLAEDNGAFARFFEFPAEDNAAFVRLLVCLVEDDGLFTRFTGFAAKNLGGFETYGTPFVEISWMLGRAWLPSREFSAKCLCSPFSQKLGCTLQNFVPNCPSSSLILHHFPWVLSPFNAAGRMLAVKVIRGVSGLFVRFVETTWYSLTDWSSQLFPFRLGNCDFQSSRDF